MIFKRKIYSGKKLVMESTEETFVCPIVGPPKDLGETVLPTGSDILQYSAFLKSKYGSVSPNRILEIVLDEIFAKIKKIWKSAHVTTVSKQRIKYLLRKLHLTRRDLMKSIRLINKDSYKIKLKNFKSRTEQLFDIAICKCRIEEKCYCQKGVKVNRNVFCRFTAQYIISITDDSLNEKVFG